MDSTKAFLLLLGLILMMNLGLRCTRSPAESPNPSNSQDPASVAGKTDGDSPHPATASDPTIQGSDARSWGVHGVAGPVSEIAWIGLRHRRMEMPPGHPAVPGLSAAESGLGGSQPAVAGGDPDMPDLPSLVRGLESALTLEEQASWADRIAVSGGAAAVEALVRASLHRRSIEEAEVLHEAFKGFSTEAEMEALAISLGQTDDVDLIEALVETLARGARSSTVERLARLHQEASPAPATQAVLGWAIERIRNPEAAEALARWVGTPEPPDWADAGIIALSALQSQAETTIAPSP